MKEGEPMFKLPFRRLQLDSDQALQQELETFCQNLRRTGRCQRHQLPSKRLLHQLVRKRPQSAAELLALSDFSPAKMEQYGRDLLHILQKYHR